MVIEKAHTPISPVADPLPSILDKVAERESTFSSPNGRAQKAEQGQFFTPPRIARFMASLFDLRPGPSSLLDPGAGLGSLTAAFVDRWLSQRSDDLDVTAIESDPSVLGNLKAAHRDIKAHGITTQVLHADFLKWYAASNSLLTGDLATFDYAILNPPYFKLSSRSEDRATLRALGLELTNMYAAFLALAARALKSGGQLVAITPRSFTNGPYFLRFRQDFFTRMSISRIHTIDARNLAFAHDDVLQETIIIHAYKSSTSSSVHITSGDSTASQGAATLTVPYHEVLDPKDPSLTVRVPRDKIDLDANRRLSRLSTSLNQLSIAVSTGPIVEYRSHDHIDLTYGPNQVPLIYPRHLRPHGHLEWPGSKGVKPISIERNASTAEQLMPQGTYVLVKRFTAKEEKKRIVASTTAGFDSGCTHLGFENHLNVYHRNGKPLPKELAIGLAAFLNSSLVDLHFRQRSGHTQVNAADLKALLYPTAEELTTLGRIMPDWPLSPFLIDELVVSCIPALQSQDSEGDLLMAHQRVTEAREVLKDLGLPKPQTNERSALTLLSVLNLTPERRWVDVEQPMIGITPMMEFMDVHYGKTYAPNTRETIRRQTVHQFVEAGLLQLNPDKPDRPTNSGQTVYQATDLLLSTVRMYGTSSWDEAVSHWQARIPALREQWRQVRDMEMIPVMLPNRDLLRLSPGGQNPLLKALIEEFCPRFTPGAEILYVGDAGSKFALYERDTLESLGITIDEHGKMPDLVVLDRSRNWLLLVEAVTSHGPVDPKRQAELNRMFSNSAAGLVYVTAFPDKRTLSSYIHSVSWESEVWVADDPTHMIHFDGERFLGPYC